MDKPLYTIQCELRDVTKANAGWSHELHAYLEEILLEEDILIVAKFHSNAMPIEADIFVNTKNLVNPEVIRELQRKMSA